LSLEYWKREKNRIALTKGYPRDPEGLGFKYLLKRLRKETKELKEALIDETGFEDMRVVNFYTGSQAEAVIKECADVSNFVDFIASKAAMHYPDKHISEKEAEG